MSVEAMTWALHHAPAKNPVERLILVTMADRVGRDGRGFDGCWASQAWIAECVEVSVSTVKRHIRNMESRGLIYRGDQSMTAHLRPDRRPVVWNLNPSLRREEKLDSTGGQFDRSSTGARTGGQKRGNGGSLVNERGVTGERTGGHSYDLQPVRDPSVTRPDPSPYRPLEGDSRPRAAAKTRNGYPEAFEEWWRTYPRRKNASKKAAHTQWAKAVKEVDTQRLLELTAAYARNPGVSDERYIPHPQKWLKDQRWESVDETNTGSISKSGSSGISAWLGYDPNAPQSDIVDAEIIDTKELPSWTG